VDIGGGPGRVSLLWEVLLPVRGQEDCDRSIPQARDASRRLDPADAGHVDVDQDEIRLERHGELDGLLARSGLTDELESRRRA
jgi:hypothetical protein